MKTHVTVGGGFTDRLHVRAHPGPGLPGNEHAEATVLNELHHAGSPAAPGPVAMSLRPVPVRSEICGAVRPAAAALERIASCARTHERV
jgi:hypothetical protein